MNENEIGVFKKAMDAYGFDAQSKVFAEELGEAITAMMQYLNNKRPIDSVLEEIADAEIMIDQMKLYFGEDGINAYRAKKLARLEDRLNNPTKFINK
jgi:hypothetical protein